MADVQGGYSDGISAARVGMIANSIDAEIISGTNETADVPFGVAMIAGDNPDGFKLGAAGYFKGITTRYRALPPQNGDKFQIGDGVGLLREGFVWVTTLAACTPGQPVYRNATGQLTPTAAGSTLIDRAFFDTAADAGGLARIDLR